MDLKAIYLGDNFVNILSSSSNLVFIYLFIFYKCLSFLLFDWSMTAIDKYINLKYTVSSILTKWPPLNQVLSSSTCPPKVNTNVTPITKDEFSCFELRKNEFTQYVFFCAWFYSLDALSVEFTHSVLHSRHLFTFIAIPHANI